RRDRFHEESELLAMDAVPGAGNVGNLEVGIQPDGFPGDLGRDDRLGVDVGRDEQGRACDARYDLLSGLRVGLDHTGTDQPFGFSPRFKLGIIPGGAESPSQINKLPVRLGVVVDNLRASGVWACTWVLCLGRSPGRILQYDPARQVRVTGGHCGDGPGTHRMPNKTGFSNANAARSAAWSDGP
ncbi:MAG: hypothetical protein VCE12_06200, partial [Candidatus Latescibacterota bacterium]